MIWQDEKPSFEDIVETYGNEQIYGTTVMADDKATQQLLLDWFFDYKIAPDDSTTFLKYFRRRINDLYPRYLSQVRIMTISSNIDPFVQHYFERQEKGTRKDTETGKADSTQTTEKTITGNTESSNTSTRTPDITTKSDTNRSVSGNGSTNSTTTITPNITEESRKSGSDSTEITTNKSGSTSGESSTTSDSENSKTGNDKSKGFGIAYPEANMAALPVSLDDMASETLDYVSNGNYNLSSTNESGTVKETSVGNESTSQEEEETREETATYGGITTNTRKGTESTVRGDENTSNSTETGTNTSATTGTEKNEGSNKSSNTANETGNITGSNTSEKTNEGIHTADTREQGRNESVTDILARVIPVLQGTDELLWFVKSLEVCFDCFDYM